MLLGIGADILHIERFRRSLARFGPGYLEEVFTDEELARSQIPSNMTEAAFYARAFCAKEACSKALGTGIDETVDWYDISVDQSTSPATIRLFNGAKRRLAALVPPDFQSVVSLDVGTKEELAHACVILVAVRQNRTLNLRAE